MPIYEYQCAGCGAQFEKLSSLAQAHTTQECPMCGEKKGERVLSVTGIGGHGGSAGPSCGPAGFG